VRPACARTHLARRLMAAIGPENQVNERTPAATKAIAARKRTKAPAPYGHGIHACPPPMCLSHSDAILPHNMFLAVPD